MGDSVPQTPWDFSLWTRVDLPAAFCACNWPPLPYNQFACPEDRALQGWNSSAVQARSGRRSHGRLPLSPHHHLRTTIFLSNRWGPPQGAPHASDEGLRHA
jgi:hypothetical protein